MMQFEAGKAQGNVIMQAREDRKKAEREARNGKH